MALVMALVSAFGVGVGVGVGMGVIDGLGVGVTTGAGTLALFTQTSFLPFFMHLNSFPALMTTFPAREQFAPALTAP